MRQDVSPLQTVLSIVSHGHGPQVTDLLTQLARLSARQLTRLVLTLNVEEPAVAAAVQGQDWPFELQIIQNRQPRGFGANHNAALLPFADAACAVVNPDIALSTDPFPALFAALAQPQAGCAYPLQHNAQGQLQDSTRALPTPAALLQRWLLGQPSTAPASVDWVNAAFMLFPTGVFQRLGGFDDGYFMYCEDVDICLRLQLLGLRLVPAACSVVHAAQRGSRRDARHLLWHLRSLWRLWNSASYRDYQRLLRAA